MSVSLYNLYAQSCTNLAKSIIIKSEAVARAINRQDRVLDQVYKLGYYNEYDPTTWRYYMHMSGKYHPLDGIENFGDPNAKIRITSIDTIEEIDFTIENLRDHRATWQEYQKGSTYYQKLVDKYPKLVKLIDGILNPIDMKVAISARDNQILQYDKRYVEGNEMSLMENIQKHTDWFFNRYDNEDYEKTDNLYVAAKIGIFYTYLPYIIMQIRYEKARTIEAHSFHVWSYLGSHQYLDEYRDHLNLYQRMWFYRNIRWVEANPGKMSTFEKLIDVVMTNRRLPIAEFHTRQLDNGIEENTDVFYPGVNYKRTPLNLKDVITKAGNTKTIVEMLEKEQAEARDNEHYFDIDLDEVTHRLTRSGDKTLSTKALESFATDSSKRHAIRLGDIQLNEWLYMTTQGLYTAKISVVNPKTSDVYSLSQNEALVLFIYSLLKSKDIDIKWIPTIVARNVLKRKKPTLKHVRTMINELLTPPIYAYAAHEYTPSVPKIISTVKFSEFCQQVWETRNIHRNLYSYTQDYRTHIQVKQLTDQFYESVVCKLVDKKTSFSSYFKGKGWELSDLSNSDFAKLANEITTKALGNDLVKKYSLREVQGMMIRLMKQLSSYSVQFLKTINEEDIITIDWAYLRMHNGVVGKNSDDTQLGLMYRHSGQTNMNCLDFSNFRTKLFNHDKQGVIKFPLSASNSYTKLYHLHRMIDQVDEVGNTTDNDNLILGFKESGLMKLRTLGRIPTTQITSAKLVIRQPTVTNEEPINTWDMSKFRIHKTTEDRSRVLVDDEGNLIVRGVVYVKKDYRGK